MNSARAEPRASDAYAQCSSGAGMALLGAASPAAMASALVSLWVANESEAVAEDAVPAAQLGRQVEDRDDDHDVDQRVLDERDERGRAQARGVRVGREHREREEQRQVLDEPVGVLGADAHHLEDDLDADQLERDVGHRREDAGQRDRQRERPAVVAALDEVGRRDVAVPVADRPQPGQEQEDQRVDHDRVGHGEEADRAAGVQQRGHRNEGVGRVEVAADQEPGDEGAEPAAAQAPLVEAAHVGGPTPPRGDEAEDRDEQEEEEEDAERDRADVAHRFACPVAVAGLGEVVGDDGQHHRDGDHRQLEPEVEGEPEQRRVLGVVERHQQRQDHRGCEEDHDQGPAGGRGHQGTSE